MARGSRLPLDCCEGARGRFSLPVPSDACQLVHHADVIALKGDSYRLKDRDLGRVPTTATDDN